VLVDKHQDPWKFIIFFTPFQKNLKINESTSIQCLTSKVVWLQKTVLKFFQQEATLVRRNWVLIYRVYSYSSYITLRQEAMKDTWHAYICWLTTMYLQFTHRYTWYPKAFFYALLL
jgi:hypothetical protein